MDVVRLSKLRYANAIKAAKTKYREVPESKPRFDWREYFLSFFVRHGEPVEHGGKLLFRDGWTYSLTTYEGPEWPPPTDFAELDALITRYWVIRLRLLTPIAMQLAEDLRRIKELQESKSLPLQHHVTYEDDRGARKREVRPFDVTRHEERLKWVRDDIRECNERLKELEAAGANREAAEREVASART